jgi:aspartate 1-decarboxylase
VNKGDKIIIMAFEYSDVPVEAKTILVDEKNRYVKRL